MYPLARFVRHLTSVRMTPVQISAEVDVLVDRKIRRILRHFLHKNFKKITAV